MTYFQNEVESGVHDKFILLEFIISRGAVRETWGDDLQKLSGSLPPPYTRWLEFWSHQWKTCFGLRVILNFEKWH